MGKFIKKVKDKIIDKYIMFMAWIGIIKIVLRYKSALAISISYKKKDIKMGLILHDDLAPDVKQEIIETMEYAFKTAMGAMKEEIQKQILKDKYDTVGTAVKNPDDLLNQLKSFLDEKDRDRDS